MEPNHAPSGAAITLLPIIASKIVVRVLIQRVCYCLMPMLWSQASTSNDGQAFAAT